MRYLNSLLLSFFLLCSFVGRGQSANISGTVTGSGSALSAATVSLLSSKDSSWIRSEITGDKGNYSFKSVTPGRYIVTATYIGHGTGSQAVEVGADDKRIDIDLPKDSSSLAAVQVTARKPFIEMSMGKTIVNIEGTTTTAGLNALELMRRLPGVTVDQNGNIAMMGKDGVMVLIDDRPTYLSGDDLANYLHTITADEISQMELISQPGAKYDAAGNAGIINIKLRKNKQQGWNGNLSVSCGQGVFFSRHEDLVLNYRRNKMSFSATASDMTASGFADWHERIWYIDQQTGTVTSNSTLHSNPVERFSTTALRLAADYVASDNTTFGISTRSSYHPNTMPTDLTAIDSDLVNKTVAYRDEHMHDFSIRRDLTANAYCTHKFSKTSSLDINFDYLTFNKLFNHDYSQVITDATGNLASDPIVLSSHQPQQINVYSIKADHTSVVGNEVKLEAGIKSSLVSTDANAMFSELAYGTWINDTGLTNHFVYKENINAVYATVSRSWKKWEARAGLRAEQTIADGTQYVNYAHFTRNYISPFPTLYMVYKNDSANQFELNYGRRVDRPRYTQLNPLAFYSFQNTFEVGNPMLQPQFTNVLELKHSYKNIILTKVTYSATAGVITDMLEVHDSSTTVYNIDRNFSSNNYLAGSVTFNKDVYKWFSLNATGTVFTAEYSGPVNNVLKTVRWSGWSFDANGQLDLGHGWKTEFYVNYFSAGRWGILESFDGHVYMEFGASKKISDKFTARFSANDPFELDRLHTYTNGGNFSENVTYRYASRQFSASLTWNFGKKTGESRQAKDMDEARRL